MSSLYLGLDVFYQLKARVPEVDQCSVYSVHCMGVGGGVACQILRQNTASPRYNDDIALLILQYLISGVVPRWQRSRMHCLVSGSNPELSPPSMNSDISWIYEMNSKSN